MKRPPTKYTTQDMSMDEMVRWLCLVESIQVADKKMKEMGLDPEEYDWVRPIAIEKYITERFPSMKCDVLYEMKHPESIQKEEPEFVY